MKKLQPHLPRSLTKIVIPIVLLLTLLSLLWNLQNPNQNTQHGVTFSPSTASFYNLDWKKVYLSILEDLGVKYIRLPTYWNKVEPTFGKFDFSEVDFMLEMAKTHQARVILVVGRKQPRWPECHQPEWVNQLSPSDQQSALLSYIKQTVLRYQDHPEVMAWQVENEALFPFGLNCPPSNESNLKEEISLVKTLDPYRGVILTDTGELSGWGKEMQLSDILGISLYRKVYDSHFGYIKYPLPPSFYILKSYFTRLLLAPNNQKTLVLELQAEPWFPDNPLNLSSDSQSQIFTLPEFKKTINFNRKVGFDQSYLWGVEWWYFMKVNGHPQYWEYAKTLF